MISLSIGIHTKTITSVGSFFYDVADCISQTHIASGQNICSDCKTSSEVLLNLETTDFNPFQICVSSGYITSPLNSFLVDGRSRSIYAATSFGSVLVYYICPSPCSKCSSPSPSSCSSCLDTEILYKVKDTNKYQCATSSLISSQGYYDKPDSNPSLTFIVAPLINVPYVPGFLYVRLAKLDIIS